MPKTIVGSPAEQLAGLEAGLAQQRDALAAAVEVGDATAVLQLRASIDELAQRIPLARIAVARARLAAVEAEALPLEGRDLGGELAAAEAEVVRAWAGYEGAREARNRVQFDIDGRQIAAESRSQRLSDARRELGRLIGAVALAGVR